MKSHLAMIAAGPNTQPLQDWAESNVFPVLVIILVVCGLLASISGKTSKIIAILGCVILVGVLYSGAALEIGGSLGEMFT